MEETSFNQHMFWCMRVFGKFNPVKIQESLSSLIYLFLLEFTLCPHL